MLRAWARFERTPAGRERVYFELGGVEHSLLPSEALWLAAELLDAARDGLVNKEAP